MIDVAAVMDGMAAALEAVPELNVYAYPPDSVAVPAAIVAYPDLSYDLVMARGADQAEWPVHVVIGRVSDRSARDALAPYLHGGGPRSVKAALEDDPTLGGAADSVRVIGVNVAFIAVGGVDYLAATFAVDVIA